ncbi:E3 ubiquitin-protein ligase WAV3-like [Zingiber officinale]|uniref:Uncharacterized protein n=1 Tax=Zingiber officinale TaxID=94328 RepID=A0A8J5EVQ9_ZINOF|nr:E3 ubiquitin-protein ligase WAV3-like [Zingiber officinale]KAG6475029.1 hypothetical protein ZIOFF_064246 [Zingiber officinale]
MANSWSRAKRAFGLNLCVSMPQTADIDDDGPRTAEAATGGRRDSTDAAFPSDSSPGGSTATQELQPQMPTTPNPSSGGLRLRRSLSRSTKKTCTICLGTMKAGQGHALFTAECSHTFHFQCIAFNVKYGNYVCPVCRAKWKELPFQAPLTVEHPHGRARVNPVNWSQEDGQMTVIRMLTRANSANQQHRPLPFFHASEPSTFNDDEPLNFQPVTGGIMQPKSARRVEIKSVPLFSAVPKSVSQENFIVLIRLKSSNAIGEQSPSRNLNIAPGMSRSSRAPVDLVTILDTSGSMAGTKLALLKRAMSFVIQNLGPLDRLSVIAFSSTARRLFPLRKMTESGRQQALLAVNSLVSSGGTNIAEGLRKGAKVIDERKEQNPVCSVILLSDGQDTYTMSSNLGRNLQTRPDYRSLIPSSILGHTTHQIPVHTFGFGTDHDSSAMHSISEISGGTFSFIESEIVIQDAFAQCIGGLLSVVVKEMHLTVESVQPGVQIVAIKSGSYTNKIEDNMLSGSINVANLYADEERDFLVYINLPPSQDTRQLRVRCAYVDAISKETVSLQDEVRIERPETVVSCTPSVEVDRQIIRVQSAEAMQDARDAADHGALDEAVYILEEQRRRLADSLARLSGDQLCLALDAELREMQERMASQQRYESSGRAYLLSGLSSHSWQRATARGDSTESASLLHAYQTPSMVDMLHRSQIFSSSPRVPTRRIQSSRSFSGPPQLR